MGLTFSILESRKYNGIRYHELDVEQQKESDISFGITDYYEPKEIFYCGKWWDILKFFRTVSTRIDEFCDEGAEYFYIDNDNIERVLSGLKRKIDQTLVLSDKYHRDTYSVNSDLHIWSDAYTSINDFYNDHNSDDYYLIIDAGW